MLHGDGIVEQMPGGYNEVYLYYYPRLAKLGKDRSVEFDRDMLQAIRLVFKDDTEIYFNEDSDIEQMDLF